MIAETRKDLVDRREFYYLVTSKMNEKENGATLNSSLTLREILDIFQQLESLDDIWAEWVYGEEPGKTVCSWCLSKPLRDDTGHTLLTKYCPRCGRRMKAKGVYD